MTSWELSFLDHSTGQPPLQSRHVSREETLSRLADRMIDAGITMYDDPDVATRAAAPGDYSATFTLEDGRRISYAIREIRTEIYLSLAQFAERIGVAPNSMSRYKLPDPDVIIGQVNPDGTPRRGSVRGWLPETVDRWRQNRPGKGTRTDLAWPPR